jgi:hypothetical protein
MTPKPQPKPFKRDWTSAILTNLAFLSLIGGLFYCKHPMLGFIALFFYLLLLAAGSRAVVALKAKQEADELKRSAHARDLDEDGNLPDEKFRRVN